MGRPRLLLLDEPSLGLAPIIVGEVFDTIRRIRDEGITVILVEQNAKKSLSICDYAYVLENGRMVKSGPGRQMLDDPDIAAAYLGVREE
jgi:branched-chain amino acid transport system ATP-binding protein